MRARNPKEGILQVNGVFAVGHKIGKIVGDPVYSECSAIFAQFGDEIMPE